MFLLDKILVFQTYDESKLRSVCDALKMEDIKYSTKFKNISSLNDVDEASIIKFSPNTKPKILYSIYVASKDVTTAKAVIHEEIE